MVLDSARNFVDSVELLQEQLLLYYNKQGYALISELLKWCPKNNISAYLRTPYMPIINYLNPLCLLFH